MARDMVLAGPKFEAMAALAITTSRCVIPWDDVSVLMAREVELVDEQSSSWIMRVEEECVGREVRIGLAVDGVRTHAMTVL